MSQVVEAIPYNPNWPHIFEKEAMLVKEALCDNCLEVHHVGSTSVPGLSGKPVIDMIPVVLDIKKLIIATRGWKLSDTKLWENMGFHFAGIFKKE